WSSTKRPFSWAAARLATAPPTQHPRASRRAPKARIAMLSRAARTILGIAARPWRCRSRRRPRRRRGRAAASGQAFAGLAELSQRTALGVDGRGPVCEERLPRHALWVRYPLFVGSCAAADGVLFLDEGTLGAAQSLVDFGKFALILCLDAEMGDSGRA